MAPPEASHLEEDGEEEQEDPILLLSERSRNQDVDISDVMVVHTPELAAEVCHLLCGKLRNRIHACDTEVSDIDVTSETPVGHGNVVCLTIYSGPDVDFSFGRSSPPKPRLWIDTMEDAAVLQAMKPFLQDKEIKKVWHNYAFDRHVLFNHGVDVQGFGGDTIHMARLWDSARTGKGYSLENLTSDSKVMGEVYRGKKSIKELFGKPKVLKNGSLGKTIEVPPIQEIQTDPESRCGWIDYSAYDAEATWELWNALERRLKKLSCSIDKFVVESLGNGEFTMWDFYKRYWRPFGELLTSMERNGVLVRTEHLEEVEKVALKDKEKLTVVFRRWAANYCQDANLLNVGSGSQIRQLLYGGTYDKKKNERLPISRDFKVLNEDGYIVPGEKKAKKHRTINIVGVSQLGIRMEVNTYTAAGWPAVSLSVLRALAGNADVALEELHKLGDYSWDNLLDQDLSERSIFEEEEVDDKDVNSLRAAIHLTNSQYNELKEYAERKGLGTAYASFGGGREGLEACIALNALCDISAIDTLLSNFIISLQAKDLKGPSGRVHCSLNINTETGRLSARRPNLQNQPALEKDRYKIRDAFTADVSAGKCLIVADYGQLELRLLAHMSQCQSMLHAFEVGGDFHSRTALGMYPHIKKAVDEGKCLLEWKGLDGEEPPAPMLKDVFGAERRRAKVLNFSIAYGKTAHGLAKDWGVELKEAADTVERWYADRPEVREWQRLMIREAKHTGYVSTLLGRKRRLPNINNELNYSLKSHSERAAINTPIQGSAADVAMLAMLQINSCKKLESLGYQLLLQVHDEVILEGPRSCADEALALVVDHMRHPFEGTNPLSVDLSVDAKFADTWYEAK